MNEPPRTRRCARRRRSNGNYVAGIHKGLQITGAKEGGRTVRSKDRQTDNRNLFLVKGGEAWAVGVATFYFKVK